MTTVEPIFSWDDGHSWIKDVQGFASSLLTPKLKARLKRGRVSCWSDNIKWIEDEYALERFRAIFVSHYRGIKGFHGCRPTSVSSYMETGLVGQSSERIIDSFRALYSDVSTVQLDAAIATLVDRGAQERGKVYFCATAEELVDYCGHYLIQGSEYLMSLAAALCSRSVAEDYRLRLRKRGIPTVFEVDIPVEYLPDLQLDALCKAILSAWGQQVTGIDVGMSEPCYIIHRDIEPRYIRAHHHPTAIPDPHFGFRLHREKAAICDVCHR